MSGLDLLEVLLLMSVAVGIILWLDILLEQRETRKQASKRKEEPHESR